MSAADRIEALAALRRWAEVEGAARHEIASDPDDWRWWSWLARSLRELDRGEEALDAARTAVAAAPETASAHVALGRALLAVGRQRDAIFTARIAQALEPDNADSLRVLIEAAAQSDVEMATTAVERLHELAPSDPSTGEYAARVALEGGRLEDAVRLATTAVARDPQSSHGRWILGDALHRLGRHVDALPHLREALRLLPTDVGIRRLLAEVIVAAKSSDDALHLDLIRSLAPKPRAFALISAAWGAMDVGRLDEADRLLDAAGEALTSLPEAPTVAYLIQLRASVLGRRGNVVACLAMLLEGEPMARARFRDPDLESYLETVGVAALRAGRPDLARARLDEVIASAESAARRGRVAHDLGLLAEVFLDQDDLAGAVATAIRSLEVARLVGSGSIPTCRYRLGMLCAVSTPPAATVALADDLVHEFSGQGSARMVARSHHLAAVGLLRATDIAGARVRLLQAVVAWRAAHEPVEPPVLAGLAVCAHHRGRGAMARRLLSMASSRSHRASHRRWVAQAETSLAGGDVVLRPTNHDVSSDIDDSQPAVDGSRSAGDG